MKTIEERKVALIGELVDLMHACDSAEGKRFEQSMFQRVDVLSKVPGMGIDDFQEMLTDEIVPFLCGTDCVDAFETFRENWRANS